MATNLGLEVQTQSQRRDITLCAIEPGGGGYECWGSGKKFSHRMVRFQKPPPLVPLYDNSYYTVLLSRHLYNPT